MQRFIARYAALITGVLSGFDRLVFRGSLLPLMREGGMYFFLERAGTLYTSSIHVQHTTKPSNAHVRPSAGASISAPRARRP